jgi:hypothetical protein
MTGRKIWQRRLLVTCGLWLSTFAGAAPYTARFQVAVQPVEICVSSSRSDESNAVVEVSCQGNQFVSITPLNGQPFVGASDGGCRFTPAGAVADGSGRVDALNSDPLLNPAAPCLRVLDLTKADERLQLLVSF